MMPSREARVLHCFKETELRRGGRRSPDGSKMGGGEPVTAVSGLKAQVSVCGTERMAQQSRGSNLAAAEMNLKWFPLRDLINYFLIQ